MKITQNVCFLACISIIALNNHPQQNNFLILQDDAAARDKGYNNCDMRTNGEQKTLQNLIKNGDLIFDVGAHMGQWTNFILETHSSNKFYAFEPIPSVFEKMASSHANLLNFKAFNLALSNTIGTASFVYYQKDQSSAECSSLFQRPIIEKNLDVQPTFLTIPTNTIDHFCTEHAIDHIDFLKIDTEGAELLVLQGTTCMLQKKQINIIQFEYGGTYQDSKTTLKEVYLLLTQNEYSVFRIIPNGLVWITQWHDELENYQYSNYLATCPETTSKLMNKFN